MNDFVFKQGTKLEYDTLGNNILAHICRAGRGAVILKRKAANFSRNPPPTPSFLFWLAYPLFGWTRSLTTVTPSTFLITHIPPFL